MAITQNTYTGNGSTVLYSFTFPYLDATDIRVSVNGTLTTAYTLANATTVQFNTAPANGAAIRIYRVTDDGQLAASFYPGSAIRSQDLNENFTQGIYIAQEATRDVAEATAQVSSAVTTANTASANAAAAVSTANTAAANASAAVSTANSALSTANASAASASNAVSTANSAASAASAATSTANTAAANASAAVSTANTASSNASTALSTANSAASDASTALSTANTAASNASTALSTANTALSNSNSALTTAGNADVKADAAIAAVASSVNYTGVANVAAIPSSPANNTYIEVADATGLESFTPLAGMPVGFVGDSGLRVRLRYTTTGSTWNWIDYFPTDADARYVQETAISDSVVTTSSTSVASSTAVKAAKDAADNAASAASAAQSTANAAGSAASAAQSTANQAVSDAAAAQSTANQAVSDAAAAQSTANAALPKSGGTMTGDITFAGTQTFPAASTSAPGVVQLSDSTNSASSTTAATSAAVKSVQDFAQVVSTTANAALPKAGGTMTGGLNVPSINNGPLAGFRNRIINGDMSVMQRGAQSGSGFSGYTLDRWLFSRTGAGATTVTQSTVSGYGSAQALFVSAASAPGESFTIEQRIEAANCQDLAGKTVTVSFITAAVTSAGSLAGFSCRLAYANSLNNWAGDTQIGVSTFSISGSPSLITIQFSVPSAATTGLKLQISGGQSGASGTISFYIGSIQLEPGPVATPFERRPTGMELALCQRYYQVTKGNLQIWTAGTLSVPLPYFQVMRAAPTAAFSGGSSVNAVLEILENITASGARYTVQTSGAGFVVDRNVALSAEL